MFLYIKNYSTDQTRDGLKSNMRINNHKKTN